MSNADPSPNPTPAEDHYVQVADRLLNDHLRAASQLQPKIETGTQPITPIITRRVKTTPRSVYIWSGAILVGFLLIYTYGVVIYNSKGQSSSSVSPLKITANSTSVSTPLIQNTQPADQNLTDFSYNRGMIFLESKDYAEAIRMFQKTIAADAAYIPAYVNSAYASVQLKDYATALRLLQTAEKLNPNEPRLLLMMAITLGLRGEIQQAIFYLNRTKQLAPNTPFALKADSLLLDLNNKVNGR